MHKAFKFRLYPNKEQEERMAAMLETHRRLYNDALAERRGMYMAEGRSVSYKEQAARLTADRKSNVYLAAANHNSCQRTLKRLDKAFQAFFRRVKEGAKPGYPRFKSRDRFDSVEFTYDDGAKVLDGAKVRFQHVGEVKTVRHRSIEGTIKTATFKREADHWYAVFSCELPDVEIEPSQLPPVGIDLGLKAFLVTNGGESIDPPKFYRKAQDKLAKLSRQLSRKRKGSNNRRKAKLKVARLHRKTRNQRKDWHYKTALDLVRAHGVIAHEALNVKGMVRSNLGKSIHDAGWSSFLAILARKAEEAGARMVAVNPKGTTQACSGCGKTSAVPLTLSERVYRCCFCGLVMDRDRNAAVNILRRAGV